MTASHPLAGVRARRTMLGVTAASIAERLSVHPNTYSRLERGERTVSLPKARTIAAMLGCSIDDLEREPSLEEQIEYLRAQHATTNGPESALPIKAQWNTTFHAAQVTSPQSAPESLSGDSTSSVVKSPAPHQPPADEDPALKRLLDELNDATGEPE